MRASLYVGGRGSCAVGAGVVGGRHDVGGWAPQTERNRKYLPPQRTRQNRDPKTAKYFTILDAKRAARLF